MPSIAPNGNFREVPVDDLFFSTTSDKGLIKESNDVFVDLSRHSLDELTGAPHNIIRHPHMPGGAFREMWNRLQAGKTFAGYVRNLAGDGETYDVYATVSPIPGTTDFLSVRQRPCHNDHFSIAMDVYQQVTEEESKLRAEGMSAHDAATKGHELLLSKLAEAGFPSFGDYQQAMLPWEIQCREGMSAGLPQRPDAPRLDAARAVHSELDHWMAGLDELLETAQELGAAKDRLLSSLGSAEDVQRTLQTVQAGSTPLQVLLFQLNVWIGMQSIVDGYVHDVVDLLDEVVASCLEARFDISVARLHATMLATFVAEIIDGRGNVEAHERQLELLRSVVRASVAKIDTQAFSRAQTTRRTAKKLRSLVGLMGSPSELLRDAIQQAETTGQEDVLAAVRTVFEGADSAMTELSGLAERLESSEVVLDVSPIYTQLTNLDA